MIKFLKKHKSISILFMLLIIYLMNANDLIINLDKKMTSCQRFHLSNSLRRIK